MNQPIEKSGGPSSWLWLALMVTVVAVWTYMNYDSRKRILYEVCLSSISYELFGVVKQDRYCSCIRDRVMDANPIFVHVPIVGRYFAMDEDRADTLARRVDQICTANLATNTLVHEQAEQG